MDFQELFIDPVQQFQFMRNALMAAVLVGSMSGIIGTFVVIRGMSFFGDALAHSVLPGVAIAYYFGRDLFLGGLIAGVVSALGIGWLTRGERVREDTAIGVVFVTMFALGIAIISATESYSTDLTHILFGNILGVRPDDLRIIQYCMVAVIAFVVLFYKELLVISFDPALGRVLKLPTESLRLALLTMIAVTIVASLRTVGVALMLAMLITPAATAQLLVKRLHWMVILAALIGAFSGAAGLYISYYRDIAPGPSIVLTASGLFGIVFSTRQITDWIGRRFRFSHPAT
ncbi:MAG: metal ABC transporter permease [Anaerolineales bacterium]